MRSSSRSSSRLRSSSVRNSAIALGALDQVRGEALDRRFREVVARPHQRLGGRGVERAQAEPLGRRLPHQERDERGERMPPVDLLATIGGDEEERQLVDPARDEAQQVEAGAVRPMEVLEHEHERSLRGQGNEEVARLREEVRLARRAVEAGDGRASAASGRAWTRRAISIQGP